MQTAKAGGKSRRGRRWVAGLGMLLGISCVSGAQQAANPAAPSTPPAAQTEINAPSSLPGTIRGVVTDVDGAFVAGAHVTLTPASGTNKLETTTDNDGRFQIPQVAPGAFLLMVRAEGWQPVLKQGRLEPSEELNLPSIELGTPTAQFEVNALSPHEAAEIDVKLEEKQRLLGILPNFGVTYNWHARPLDTKQKFELATRSMIDPMTFAINAGVTLGEHWSGRYDEFGTGAEGYWHLYGVTMAGVAIDAQLGGAILPSLFHQDPRYFWKGTGSVKSRLGYALSRSVICRGDNGLDQFAWAGVLGNFSSAAITSRLYPPQDRKGVGLTLSNGALSIAADAANNVIQEFLFKHLTPSAWKKPDNAPGVEEKIKK